MPVFIVLQRPSESARVNVTMSPEAQAGTWICEDTSTTTLDFDRGLFVQSRHGDMLDSDRQLRSNANDLVLTLHGFIAHSNTGAVTFPVEGGSGTFGAAPAVWTRLEG
jgi:hypothetical protein